MFLINSCSHLVSATRVSSIREGLHHQERTFSRSYGTILPSSFTRVLSSALVFCTRPPVSVWGTIPNNLKLRGFSWKHGINDFTTVVARRRVSALESRIYLTLKPTHLNRGNRRLAHLAFPLPIAIVRSTGILTCFPSITPFGLTFVVDSPCPINVGQEPLVFRRGGFHPFVVTHVSIRTSDTSSKPYDSPSPAYRTLPYPMSKDMAAASVYCLARLLLPRRPTRLVSYYAFFK